MSSMAYHHGNWAAHAVGHKRRWDNVECGMPSSPLDYTPSHMKSSVAFHHVLGKHTRSDYVGRGRPSSPLGSTHRVKRCRAWNAIFAFRQHTRLEDVGQTTSSVAFHHRPWRAHTIALRRAWHDIIALGQHTRLDDVGRGIPSSSLESIHDRTTLGMACYHQSWTTHMIGSLRVWHAHMALGQHTRSDYVVCDMPSQPLSSTHG
uniref:Uncharacterized protein n=1 Tax=Solanum lycopersicum TaxID=4081 RepID=A0A494G8S5_SOLLC